MATHQPPNKSRRCVTFSLSLKEPFAQSAGMSYTQCHFLDCVDMINEVVDCWDPTKLSISVED